MNKEIEDHVAAIDKLLRLPPKSRARVRRETAGQVAPRIPVIVRIEPERMPARVVWKEINGRRVRVGSSTSKAVRSMKCQI